MATIFSHALDTAAPPRAGRDGAVRRYLLLTFALSWPVWLVGWLVAGRPESMAAPAMTGAIYLGSFAPGLAGAILSARDGGRAGLVEWARGFVRLRAGWRSYAAALLPLPLAFLIGTVLLGYAPRPGASHGMPAALFYLTLFPVSIFNGLATSLMGAGPLGEEGGWRGYLLPRLLDRFGEARASVLVGLVWAWWHLPIMALFADWRGGVGFALYLPLYTAAVVGLSFIITRVWRLGGGSLVPCVWLHGLVNAIGAVAFDDTLWTNGWSREASALHPPLVFAAVAAALFLLRGRASRVG